MIFAILSKIDIKTLFLILCLLGGFLLFWQNASLKQDLLLKDMQLQEANLNIESLNLALDKQNQALKELRVQKTKVDNKALREIVLKDSSCEAELRGYKQIFKELGK